MRARLETKVVLVDPHDSLKSTISRMAKCGDRYFGIALIVDSTTRLQGVISNGDILRIVTGDYNLDRPVRDFMVAEPVIASRGETDEAILRSVRLQMLRRSGGSRDLTRYVPIVDDNNVVYDVIDVFVLLSRSPQQREHVEIYGLGFVGLTLAVALASRGHYVSGIDTNRLLVNKLLSGEPHVFEPRLAEMMSRAIRENQLIFRTEPNEVHHRIVIIAVGTPVRNDGSVSLEALYSVCNLVASRLRYGDLIMLRSTVPVGTTREKVVTILESGSGLIAGQDFHLAFTPERTVEGKAMYELAALPQVVGGLTSRCTEKATSFWQTLTDSVVKVDSLEAAELVKLINNSYRDLSFAFANGFSLLADRFNLESSKIIAAANEGYPRNPIPVPSPGVGGYCLTKDPFLYASTDSDGCYGNLSIQGRQINEKAALYPVEVVRRFSMRLCRPMSDLSILVIGLAFKGLPETNDVRGSTGLRVCSELRSNGSKVFGYDAVVENDVIKKNHITPSPILTAVGFCDAVLILNNHPSNVPSGMLSTLSQRDTLLFDGWSMVDRHEVEQYPKVVYATMGYMTPTP